MLIAIVSFLAIIVVLIFAHELGHFITAKANGVKVEEFGIGFPPRLFAFKRGETEYSINLVPLGGFCKMLGEDDPREPRSLASKGVGARLLVLSAGSIMNILLPILLFSISFMIPSEVMVGQIKVGEVTANSPAEVAGIRPGDIVLELNGHPIQSPSDLVYHTQLNLGSEITMLIDREGYGPKTVKLTPRWNPPPEEGAVGVYFSTINTSSITRSYPIWRAIPLGARTSWDTLILFRNEITTWLIRQDVPQLAGPIGIAQLTGEVAKGGVSPLMSFAAFISINLAIINLLPIPGLDGGRIIFVIIEWLRRGKRLSPEREGLIHLIGFAMLMALIIVISYYDILRIIRGESLFP